MGTRSLTRIFDERNNELVCIYRQMDGYPSRHGQELANILKQYTMVNGLGLDRAGKVANGYGCLAAQIVRDLKEGPGSIYLEPAGTTDVGEEYEYHIKPAKPEKVSNNPFGPPPAPILAVFEVQWSQTEKSELQKLFECTPDEFENVRISYEAVTRENG